MSTATYRVTNETRAALAAMAEDLVDVAADGNAPPGTDIALLIEQILFDGHYEPEPRDEEGRIVPESTRDA